MIPAVWRDARICAVLHSVGDFLGSASDAEAIDSDRDSGDRWTPTAGESGNQCPCLSSCPGECQGTGPRGTVRDSKSKDCVSDVTSKAELAQSSCDSHVNPSSRHGRPCIHILCCAGGTSDQPSEPAPQARPGTAKRRDSPPRARAKKAARKRPAVVTGSAAVTAQPHPPTLAKIQPQLKRRQLSVKPAQGHGGVPAQQIPSQQPPAKRQRPVADPALVQHGSQRPDAPKQQQLAPPRLHSSQGMWSGHNWTQSC